VAGTGGVCVGVSSMDAAITTSGITVPCAFARQVIDMLEDEGIVELCCKSPGPTRYKNICGDRQRTVNGTITQYLNGEIGPCSAHMSPYVLAKLSAMGLKSWSCNWT
jgi:hypothetical protein